jgi:hypothetical protein
MDYGAAHQRSSRNDWVTVELYCIVAPTTTRLCGTLSVLARLLASPRPRTFQARDRQVVVAHFSSLVRLVLEHGLSQRFSTFYGLDAPFHARPWCGLVWFGSAHQDVGSNQIKSNQIKSQYICI